MDIGEIKARIAELEQRKAERNAMRGFRDVSYLDYIAGGDRSGFDRIANEETAYKNMLNQQAHQEKMLGLQQTQQEKMLGLQQDFTAKENELNRQNTLAIAGQNKAEQEQYKLDEYRRGRNKAASIMSSYKEALKKDPNNIQLNKEYNLAKEDFDFYDRKLGGQGYTEPTPEDKHKEPTNIYAGLSNEERLSIANSIHSKKAYTEEDKAKLQLLADVTDDQKTKEQILTIESNKGKTDSAKELEEYNRLDKLKKEGKNLSTKQNTRYNNLKSKYGK